MAVRKEQYCLYGESSYEVHRGHHIYIVGSAPLFNYNE